MSKPGSGFALPLFRVCKSAAPLVLVLALAACSVAEYEPPIKTFSDAATSANTALSGYSDLAVKEVAKVRREQALATPAGVRMLTENDLPDCQGDSERCRIVHLADPNDPNPRLLDPGPPIQKILLLMGEIRKYGNGLQAIVAADTAAQVEKNVDSVNGNLITLANMIGADKSFGSFATPAGEAVKWAFGAYINSVKLHALRTATENADPLITDSVEVFNAAMQEANQITRQSLAEVVSKRLDAFREVKSDANLTALLQAARTYDDVLIARPESVFKELADAHSDLTNALHDDGITWDKAFASLEQVKAHAQILEGVVTDLLAAAEAKE